MTDAEKKERRRLQKLEAQKRYAEKNRERVQAKRKAFREKNSKRLAQENKKWVEKNKDKQKAYHAEYYRKNKEKAKVYHKEYREKNKDKRLQQMREWRASEAGKQWTLFHKVENKNHIKEVRRIYRLNNRDKDNKDKAKRRAAKIKATPKWLTPEQHKEIAEFYTLASDLAWLNNGETLHVDHIVPLVNPNVCGLHVPWNLQIIPAGENMRKGNKLIVK